MTLLTFPPTGIRRAERRLAEASAGAVSPFTGSIQVQDWGGRWWEYSIDVVITQGAQGRALSAFFAQLGGLRGRFLFTDPQRREPSDVGLPIVSGLDQSGTSLATSGWLPGTTPLQTGDLIQLGSGETTRLHQLTADVISDATGLATLSLVPGIRPGDAPVDGGAIVTDGPQVILRAMAPIPTTIDLPDHYSFSFDAREAL